MGAVDGDQMAKHKTVVLVARERERAIETELQHGTLSGGWQPAGETTVAGQWWAGGWQAAQEREDWTEVPFG